MAVASSPTLDALLLEVLATPEGQADPYPRYARMREEARVSRTSFGPFVVNGYDECQAVLRDPRLGRGVGVEETSADIFGDTGTRRGEFLEMSQHNMLMADPPDHTRLRRLVSRSFSPRQVERLRPAVHALVAELLETMADVGDVDFMAEFALPAADGGHRRTRRCARGGPGGPAAPRASGGQGHRADAQQRGDRRSDRGARHPRRVLRRPARRAAAPAARRPVELARRDPRQRRPAHRRGGRVDRHPAVRGRLRDHHEPTRQRAVGPPGASRATAGLGRES